MAFIPKQELQNGKYIIDRSLNQGRFGVSYLAHNKQNQRVVIKTFKDDIWQNLSDADKEKTNNRLMREYSGLSKCNHPHIVKFHGSFLEQRQLCLVMEYIDGQDLDSLSQPILPVDTALEYIRQIGSALKVVHGQGLVHRDVKPANIMLRSGKPEVVLIDFGLAGSSDETITMNTSTRESGFAAPELYDANEKAQPYTDVYGLGATLYTLLSGQVPLDAQKRSTRGKDKLQTLPVDDRINRAITRAMKLEWEDRFQTVDEFLASLGLFTSEEPSPDPYTRLALEETRRQTRIGAYTLYITAISAVVAILLGLFGQEMKSFLMSPFSKPVPEQKSK